MKKYLKTRMEVSGSANQSQPTNADVPPKKENEEDRRDTSLRENWVMIHIPSNPDIPDCPPDPVTIKQEVIATDYLEKEQPNLENSICKKERSMSPEIPHRHGIYPPLPPQPPLPASTDIIEPEHTEQNGTSPTLCTEFIRGRCYKETCKFEHRNDLAELVRLGLFPIPSMPLTRPPPPASPPKTIHNEIFSDTYEENRQVAPEYEMENQSPQIYFTAKHTISTYFFQDPRSRDLSNFALQRDYVSPPLTNYPPLPETCHSPLPQTNQPTSPDRSLIREHQTNQSTSPDRSRIGADIPDCPPYLVTIKQEVIATDYLEKEQPNLENSICKKERSMSPEIPHRHGIYPPLPPQPPLPASIDIIKPDHTEPNETSPTLCTEFIRGQCYKETCKFEHRNDLAELVRLGLFPIPSMPLTRPSPPASTPKPIHNEIFSDRYEENRLKAPGYQMEIQNPHHTVEHTISSYFFSEPRIRDFSDFEHQRDCVSPPLTNNPPPPETCHSPLPQTNQPTSPDRSRIGAHQTNQPTSPDRFRIGAPQTNQPTSPDRFRIGANQTNQAFRTPPAQTNQPTSPDRSRIGADIPDCPPYPVTIKQEVIATDYLEKEQPNLENSICKKELNISPEVPHRHGIYPPLPPQPPLPASTDIIKPDHTEPNKTSPTLCTEFIWGQCYKETCKFEHRNDLAELVRLGLFPIPSMPLTRPPPPASLPKPIHNEIFSDTYEENRQKAPGYQMENQNPHHTVEHTISSYFFSEPRIRDFSDFEHQRDCVSPPLTNNPPLPETCHSPLPQTNQPTSPNRFRIGEPQTNQPYRTPPSHLYLPHTNEPPTPFQPDSFLDIGQPYAPFHPVFGRSLASYTSPPRDNSYVIAMRIEEILIKMEMEKQSKMEAEHPPPLRQVCRDFIRGHCDRAPYCRYEHKLFLNQKIDRSNVIIFCRDFQNCVCKYGRTCKFVHATIFEEQDFYRTGKLPVHLILPRLPRPPPPALPPQTSTREGFPAIAYNSRPTPASEVSSDVKPTYKDESDAAANPEDAVIDSMVASVAEHIRKEWNRIKLHADKETDCSVCCVNTGLFLLAVVVVMTVVDGNFTFVVPWKHTLTAGKQLLQTGDDAHEHDGHHHQRHRERQQEQPCVHVVAQQTGLVLETDKHIHYGRMDNFIDNKFP